MYQEDTGDEDDYDDDGSDLAGLLEQMRELNDNSAVVPESTGEASPGDAPGEVVVVPDDGYDYATEDNDEVNYASAEDAIRDIDSEEPCTSGAAKTPEPLMPPPVASPCRARSPATKGFESETPTSSHFLSRSLVLTYMCAWSCLWERLT